MSSNSITRSAAMVIAAAFTDAADALTSYAFTLGWAQAQAAEAIALWDQAQAATKAAQAEHEAKSQQATADLASAAGVSLEFLDPGEATREKAQAMLDRARQQLDESGDDAERVVDRARDKAPPKPKWWQRVGNAIAEFGKGFGESLRDLAGFVWRLMQNPNYCQSGVSQGSLSRKLATRRMK